MFETGRRSAISSSELGLYSDRADYNNNKYGPVVKKFVIGVMAIVAVILAAIFIYDFAATATAGSRVSQETKHIYVLQNALKKPSDLPRKSTTIAPDVNLEKLTSEIQDRSDDGNVSFIDMSQNHDQESQSLPSPEMRSQSLENFKLRKRLLDEENDEIEEQVQSKQLFRNHAVVYRVRQMYQRPDPDEMLEQESRPAPFHFELKGPQPASFKRPKFPQLTQYRYPHTSRNIQDIIKYLTNDPEGSKRGIKFTGVYVNPKKYDTYPEEIMANSDRTEFPSSEESEDEIEEESSDFAMTNHDPFYQYKPNHPAEVNLLAPANVRYSSPVHRFNPYLEPVYHRPIMIARPPLKAIEPTYDNTGAYSGDYGKKKKPKPFSVMLDIYPITDINEQPTNKVSRPRPVSSSEEYSDQRRPVTYGRGGRPYFAGHHAASQAIPLVAIPANSGGMSEEQDKQQMVFHLNLYPKKKNKFTRKDILQRSEAMRPEEQEQFAKKVMTPIELLTKQLADHSTIEESKNEETDMPTSLPFTRYQESFLEMPNEEDTRNKNESLSNHKIDVINKVEITGIEKNNKTIEDEKTVTTPIDVDTVEGFQKFADGLLKSD